MFSKSIKVLYPILHYPPVIGGLEQWSQNIAQRQPEDTEILIVTGRVGGAPNFEKKGNVIIFRTSLFELSDLSHSSIIYIATAAPYIFFRSLLLSGSINTFHCHGFVSAILGWLVSSVSRKPFICTEQSIKLRNPVSKLLARMVYGKAALCISSSRAVAKEFGKMGVRNIEIIPNGVDLKLFANRRDSIANKNGFVILSVGRLEKVKGHKYLINAFAEIKKKVPEAKLLLVGDGSERKNLERQILDLGLGDVEFIGEIPHEELPHWYHKADVFVMPSLSEGFGITSIEAMASGVPVVASRVGGLLDIVKDGENGMLVEEGDSQAIVNAVLSLYTNPQKLKQLSILGAERAQNYSWDGVASRVTRLYKNLL